MIDACVVQDTEVERERLADLLLDELALVEPTGATD